LAGHGHITGVPGGADPGPADDLGGLTGDPADADALAQESSSTFRSRGRNGTRFAVACCCTPPRRLRVTPALWERGSIACGTCGEDFEPSA
jgi:hypothetical protein